MATGFFEGGTCYAVQQEAIDAHFQSIQPSILNTSTINYKTEYIKQANGSWALNKQTISSTGVITNNYTLVQATPNQYACNLPNDPTTNFLDGVELGWAVAGVMIITFCIRSIYRR